MSGWFPKVDIDSAERRRMRHVIKGLRTKADKIRALSAAGYSKQTIASFLAIRYQQVRNVLVRSAPTHRKAGPPPLRGLAEQAPDPPTGWQASGPDEAPTHGSFVIDEQGRIALPANVIAALDGEPRRRIPWRFENGELILMNLAAGIRSAQAMCADLAREHPRNWSDELIAERRAEAAREDAEDARRRRG